MTGFHGTQQVARLAARQQGNVSLDQLRAFLSRDEIEHRRDMGWLIPRHRRVYAVGHVPRSRESTWAAAVLALGPAALLSHTSAAAAWGIVKGPVRTHVTIPRGPGHEHRDGLVVHRQILPPEHRSRRHGIPCTNLVRTLLDLAAIQSVRATARAFEEAQVLAQLAPEVLAAEVLSRPGYRGSGRLKRILAGAVDPAGVRSILELRFLRLCAAHGIPRPLVNERIGVWTPDFLWPDRMAVVETDGVDFHRTAAKRRRDAEKDAYLRAAGFTVVRLTWGHVVGSPVPTAQRIRDALSAGSAGHMGA